MSKVMRLVIRSVGTAEYPNLRLWEPENHESINVNVFVDIGPFKKKAADTFYIRLATPDGLKESEHSDNVIAERPILVVSEYDFNEFWRWLENTVKSCEAETWHDCIQNLRRYFNWEYDGYQST